MNATNILPRPLPSIPSPAKVTKDPLEYREATGQVESGFELHHLVKTKEPKLIVTPLSPMTPEQIRRLVRIMESYVRGIKAEDFVPSPGMHCSWCDYFAACRRWKGSSLDR